MGRARGIVAAGHPVTASAAAEILRAGGNAFDAALAALFASCVAEPVLASLGGGGFLLAQHADRRPPLLYDFFAQTPSRRLDEAQIEFYPIVADFGTAQQEFHIGVGSIATPGVIKGAFELHRDLCRMPLATLIEPACSAARDGIEVNALQAYIAELVAPILQSTPGALALNSSQEHPERIARCGERMRHRAFADTLELLTKEGDALFYQGEMGQLLVDACRTQGGHLCRDDLLGYQVLKKPPLSFGYHGAQLFTNPAPSVGGTLMTFSLALLEESRPDTRPPGSDQHLLQIANAQRITQQLRREQAIDRDLDQAVTDRILSEEHLEGYRRIMREHPLCSRGTTQISVADHDGNLASMTLSNGEGSGYVLPGCGVMLNNMLGEEDINPHGFNRWPENQRIASMMSPTLVHTADQRRIATGSGGSNRIRSAILQTLVNLIDYAMPAEKAVEQPRLHYEGDLLNIESGYPAAAVEQLFAEYENHRQWPQRNLFFGGAHTVSINANGALDGHGDSRRGGVSITV